MAQYKKCPYCGANLDPGEKCDCEKETDFSEQRKSSQRIGQPGTELNKNKRIRRKTVHKPQSFAL